MFKQLLLIGSLAVASVAAAALPASEPATVQSAWFVSDFYAVCGHTSCPYHFNINGTQDVPSGPSFDLTCAGEVNEGMYKQCTADPKDVHLVAGVMLNSTTGTLTITVIHDFISDTDGKSYVTSGVAAVSYIEQPSDFLIHQSRVVEV